MNRVFFLISSMNAYSLSLTEYFEFLRDIENDEKFKKVCSVPCKVNDVDLILNFGIPNNNIPQLVSFSIPSESINFGGEENA